MISVSSAESPRSRNNPLHNLNTSSNSTRRPSPVPADDRLAHLVANPSEARSQSVERREQEAVLARVKDELENWETLVFSFDMDRSGNDEGNDRNISGSSAGNPGRGRRNTASSPEQNINPQGSSQDSLESILSGAAFSGAAPQQQQISQLAHLAQLAQLSQLNAQYNLGFDLNTLNQLAAMNILSPSLNPTQQAAAAASPPSRPHPDDAIAQTLRQMQSQGMFSGANPDPSGAVPTFPFPPPLSAQTQSHQQPYMQAAQSQGLQHFPWPQAPNSAPPYGQNITGGSSMQGSPSQQRPQPSFLPPLSFPPSSGMYNYNPSPSSSNAQAGPSNPRQSRSATRTTPSSPSVSNDGGDMDDVLVQEDKRRRNTAASARFRIKKKHKVISLEKSVSELEGRAEDLEREAADLRRENGWLKEMLIMKGRRNRGLDMTPSVGDNDDDNDSEDEDPGAGDGSKKDGDDDETQRERESGGDRKGKGKAKDS